MSVVKFAIVVGNDVAGTISLTDDPSVQSAQRFIAAYRSNPVIVETGDENVMFGWTWDGTNFNPPTGE
jgi:hypothetical protein